MERNSAAGGKLIKDREERLDSRSALCKSSDLGLPGTATRTVASAEGAHDACPGPVTSAAGTGFRRECRYNALGLLYLQCIYEQGGQGCEREEGRAFSTGQGDSCVPWEWKNITLLSAILAQATRLASHPTPSSEKPGDFHNAWLGKCI